MDKKKHVLFVKASPLLHRVKTFGWRRLACSPATRPRPWWRRPSATCRSPSASTSEPPSWRPTSGPRSEFSGRVRHPDKLVCNSWRPNHNNGTAGSFSTRQIAASSPRGRAPCSRSVVHVVPRFPCQRESANICSSKGEIKPSFHLFVVL